MDSPKTARRSLAPRRFLAKFAVSLSMHSLVPSRIRVLFLKSIGVRFADPKHNFIGSDVYFDTIAPELIHVGKWCRLTTGVKILTHFFDTRHNFTPEHPFNFLLGEVKIGDFVFVGAGTVIAQPVSIGDWAVIGANSVVTRDIPPGAIASGSPARVISYRKGFGPEENAPNPTQPV